MDYKVLSVFYLPLNKRFWTEWYGNHSTCTFLKSKTTVIITLLSM